MLHVLRDCALPALLRPFSSSSSCPAAAVKGDRRSASPSSKHMYLEEGLERLRRGQVFCMAAEMQAGRLDAVERTSGRSHAAAIHVLSAALNAVAGAAGCALRPNYPVQGIGEEHRSPGSSTCQSRSRVGHGAQSVFVALDSVIAAFPYLHPLPCCPCARLCIALSYAAHLMSCELRAASCALALLQ